MYPSYKNQPIDLLCKSIDRFLYDRLVNVLDDDIYYKGSPI